MLRVACGIPSNLQSELVMTDPDQTFMLYSGCRRGFHVLIIVERIMWFRYVA